jgi:two-component system sensor histidine kinase YesM
MGFKTLKMVLQPVVENALYHGLEKMEEGGQLKIKGFRNEEGDICFEVDDNGAGIEESELEKIQNGLDSISHYTENSNSRGIGIVNIQKRIRLTFGDKYGLIIYSKLNEGTKVVIIMPAL